METATTKTKKRHRPFRVKTGCIVATRINPQLLAPHVSFQITYHPPPPPSTTTSTTNGAGTSAASTTPSPTTTTATTATTMIQYTRDAYHMVWTEPVPHRDWYWALIGKRIRCCYHHGAAAAAAAAAVVEVPPPNGTASTPTTTKENKKNRTTTTTFDGEVIRWFHSPPATHHPPPQPQHQHYQDVELLMDATTWSQLPFRLPQEDPIVSSSPKEQKSWELEQRVARGSGGDPQQRLVSVRITLLLGQNHHHHDFDDHRHDDTTSHPVVTTTVPVVIQKWAVQKCVPIAWGTKSTNSTIQKTAVLPSENGHHNGNHQSATLSSPSPSPSSTKGKLQQKQDALKRENHNHNGVGESMKHENGNQNNTTTMKHISNVVRNRVHHKKTYPSSSSVQYIGDGNDTPEQQIHNWRFFAGRYHDVLYQSHPFTPSITAPLASSSASLLSCGLVGEVIRVDPNAAPSVTLAMVTIRRMILPEHTRNGRRFTRLHEWNDIYTDYDHTHIRATNDVTITIPIEQLIVVSRSAAKHQSNPLGDNNNNDDAVAVRYAYSWAYNVYIPHKVGSDHESAATNDRSDLLSLRYCHRCRRSSSNPTTTRMIICDSVDCPLSQHGSEDTSMDTQPCVAWCQECMDELRSNGADDAGLLLPCCGNQCDCSICTTNREKESQHWLYTQLCKRTKKVCLRTHSDDKKLTIDDSLSFSASMIHSMRDRSSHLDTNISYFTLPVPHAKAKTRVIRRTIRTRKPQHATKPSRVTAKATINFEKSKPTQRKVVRDKETTSVKVADSLAIEKSPLILKRNHCAREIVYNGTKKYSFKSWIEEDRSSSQMILEKPRSIRSLQESNTRLISEQKDEVAKTSSSNRAARASQRRLLRDVASLGITSPSYLALVDTLANREPQLRFDRSSIHAWGVFADTAISSGEMIVEYRGELIGNAVAELREKEYEAAKIGSDYMFRIDALNVCDATKQGNVARFINASCDPNCYTKIITFDGLKRIVIYAKKDIQSGDELCYDYKFPIEYDETKRIPCHCGARECRGYMNWVSGVWMHLHLY